MVMNIFSPHISNLFSEIVAILIRFKDRKWKKSKKYTSKLLQEDYEDLYTGAEFLMEFRYAQILNMIWMVMMYSSGMPILYVVAVLSFIFTYFFDKLLSNNF